MLSSIMTSYPSRSNNNHHLANHSGAVYGPSSRASPTATLAPAPPAVSSAPPSRPSSGLHMAHLLQPPPPPTAALPLSGSSPYAHSYDSASASPADRSSTITDSNGSLPDGPVMIPALTGSVTHPPQKRAYRQRRKDPSCDACRERKVKCDASESTSCSECTNRKVRCQFTKETNRRMSSIKQMQDLEKQLNSTKQQLQQLRSGMLRESIVDLDLDPSGQPVLKLPDIGGRPPRRTRLTVAQDLSRVRFHVRDVGRGIMKVPPPYRQKSSSSVLSVDAPTLPPKPVADRLLRQYYSCIHAVLPILHWPTFVNEYERIYQTGSLRGVCREWAALLFSVFACGVLHTLEPDKKSGAQKFLTIANNVIDVWSDDFTLDQARVALLMSIGLFEMNSKSASWVWLSSAVRIAQDIGLHMESGPWPPIEEEMRKRLWWGIYAWDRLLSLELGKPMSIHDHDCDVDLPCPVDEQFISDSGKIPEAQQTTPLLATIHVVRSIGQLAKTLRSPVITAATLEIFDRHFNACLATFPIHYHPSSDQYLDPRSLPPIIYLQNARFILHRHNISPACPSEARSTAFDTCLSIARDTTRVLSRCLHPPTAGSPSRPSDPQEDWKALLASSATTMLCMHIWRCLLILIFREDFSAALVCIKAFKIIGNAHAVTTSCGRYIAFFLRCLLDRLQRNDPRPIDQDEEIIAYVSGDMQASTTSSWIWQGSETGSQLEAVTSVKSLHVDGTCRSSDYGSEELERWEGWEWIEQTVQYLENEQQRRASERQTTTVTQPTEPNNNSLQSNPPARSSSSNSRMTIASII